MIQQQQGGSAAYVLGASLVLLLLMGSVGLSEVMRAALLRTQAARSLTSAMAVAAQADPAETQEVERTFRQALAANMGEIPYAVTLVLVPQGAFDDITGQRVSRPVLSARMEIPFRIGYLGRWLPEVRLQVVHSEYSACSLPVGCPWQQEIKGPACTSRSLIVSCPARSRRPARGLPSYGNAVQA